MYRTVLPFGCMCTRNPTFLLPFLRSTSSPGVLQCTSCFVGNTHTRGRNHAGHQSIRLLSCATPSLSWSSLCGERTARDSLDMWLFSRLSHWVVHSLIISSLHCSHTEDVSTDMLQCLEHSVRTHKDVSSGTALHLVCGVCGVCVCVCGPWWPVCCVICVTV